MSPNGDVTQWCYNCGVEITWTPVRSWGRSYCCRECMRGDQCPCPGPTSEEEDGAIEERRRDAERQW